MAVPALVQCAGDPISFSTPTVWKKNLPNPSPGGNCLVVAATWGDSTATCTITDDKGNTWTPGPQATDGGNNARLQIFTALNVTAGTQLLTATFSTAVSFPEVLPVAEFRNIATVSATDGTATAAVTSGTTLQSGSITTASDGDLLVQVCALDNFGSPTGLMTWTAQSGFNLMCPNGISLMAAQYGVQATHGAINPTLTSSINATSAMSCTIALKSAAAGNDLASGIRLRRLNAVMFPGQTNSTITAASSFIFQFPTSGNLFVISNEGVDTKKITGITDSQSNTWHHAGTGILGGSGNRIDIWYADGNPSPSETMTATVTFTAATGDEIAGAPCLRFADVFSDIGSPAFDTQATASGNLPSTSSGPVTGAVLTPSTANGLILSFIQEDGETVTAVSPGYFQSVDVGVYSTNGVDKDDGFSVYYNPDTSQVTTTWTYSNYEGGTAIGQWYTQSVAFKAAAAAADLGPNLNSPIRGGRGVDRGPAGRRMMPQKSVDTSPSVVEFTAIAAAPFMRGKGMGGPVMRRRLLQRFPDGTVANVVVITYPQLEHVNARGGFRGIVLGER